MYKTVLKIIYYHINKFNTQQIINTKDYLNI